MRSRPAKISVRVVIFVVVIVVILAHLASHRTGGVVALTRAGASGSNSLEAHDPTFLITPYRYQNQSREAPG